LEDPYTDAAHGFKGLAVEGANRGISRIRKTLLGLYALRPHGVLVAASHASCACF
jgi:hypothetical protein